MDFEATYHKLREETFCEKQEHRKTEDALRESEERYRLLVEMSPEPILVHSEGKIIYVNKAAVGLAGGLSSAELLGRNILDFVHPDSRQAVLDRIHQTQIERKPAEIIEEKLLTLHGQTVDVETTAIPFTYNGKPATQVVIRDITERRRLAEQLQQTQKMETIGRLAGGIAHDFNNLLAGIIGTLSMLDYQLSEEKNIQKEELEDQIGIVRDCALRAAEIVQQLMSLSRRTELRPVTVDLVALASDIVKLCKVSFDPKIQISLESNGQPAIVEADPLRIKQVFLNLAINARDAMPDGGELTFSFSNPEPGMIRATIRDTGVGIDPAHVSKIFDPFFTTKPIGQGTGLGLSIVYGIVTQHKAKISVESQPGKGAAFHLDFRVSSKSMAPSSVSLSELPRGDENILVVDDEQTVRQMVKAMLRTLGYTVFCVQDGQEALAFLQESKTKIDLVVLDLIMPKMSGRTTLMHIRQLAPTLPVVVSSGILLDPHAHGLRGLKVSAILAKPYELADIAFAIRIALANQIPPRSPIDEYHRD